MHRRLDLKGRIPRFILVSDGKLHDVPALDLSELEAGAIYVMDRGNHRFYPMAYVASGRSIFRHPRQVEHGLASGPFGEVDHTTGIIYDQRIALDCFYTQHDYLAQLRRVRFKDPETGKTFVLLTLGFLLS